MFVGACDEFPNIKLVKTQRHKFSCLILKLLLKAKESIVRDGLREPVKVFPNDGEIYAIGGNTYKDLRRKCLCRRIWRKDLEGMDPHDKELLRANFEDNPVEATDAKFETCEEVFDKYLT